MAIDIVTPAASEPITLTEAKNFLRVDHSDDDTLISALITASRQMCEEYTRRILVTTTVDEYFDKFPKNRWNNLSNLIYLSRGPVASIYIGQVCGRNRVRRNDFDGCVCHRLDFRTGTHSIRIGLVCRGGCRQSSDCALCSGDGCRIDSETIDSRDDVGDF